MRSTHAFRRHGDVLLLRAAARPLQAAGLHSWPEIGDPDVCRRWLQEMWRDTAFVEALAVASPSLANAVDQLLGNSSAPPKRVSKATLSVAHYLLRSSGRSVPFGLFAGVALAGVGPAQADFAAEHHAVGRVDTLWLDHVRRDLQGRPDVLRHLSLRVNEFAVRRGASIDTPLPDGRLATARIARPLSVLLDAAATAVSGQELTNRLMALGGTLETAQNLIRAALDGAILTSNLHAPMTDADPARQIVNTLLPHMPTLSETTRDVLERLANVTRLLDSHNATALGKAHCLRSTVHEHVKQISAAGRSRVSYDLRLDATVRIPEHVLNEAEHAAHALLRLTRVQGPRSPWAMFHAVFWERYGAGCLVPVRDAIDLASGVGLPPDYPHSVWTQPDVKVLPRDERLMDLAWQALMEGELEVRLSEDDLDALSSDDTPDTRLAPHVELAVQVHATSQQAVDEGDFTLDVRPAWTGGNLTGRFASLLGRPLSDLYSTLPTMVEGAVPAQLSFAPVFPHAENIARIPALLPHVISLGEHRPADDHGVINLDNLAVYATGKALYLVSLSQRRVIEPVVLHPLALEKQAPPLARFVAMLGRGFATHWTEFDWGPLTASMPFLPRVTYRKAVLSPARWRLPAGHLPTGSFSKAWHTALLEWADRWRCPNRVDVHDDDRTVALDLHEPLHARLVHRHLQRHDHTQLTEARADAELGWIGHAHEVVVPLTSTQPPQPHPDLTHAPVVTNSTRACPGDTQQRWLQAKVFTHPTVMNEILTHQLPDLIHELDDPVHWFMRYRSLHEDDHLRIRIAVHGAGQRVHVTQALDAWTAHLTDVRLASRLVFDAYRPERGRYGTGTAMEAAEDVFVADSLVARHALADLPTLDARVLCSLGMLDIAQGLLGTHQGLEWLLSTPTSGSGQVDTTRRTLAHSRGNLLIDTSPRLAAAHSQRRAALGSYRTHLTKPQLPAVLESLLHMHHNRLMGPDRESEAASRHAARQAARSLLTWTAAS
ncbi:lantibiotic dehydratase [Streptomyces sp. SDT5-1]|uniref:lantibiotic dehydratase n=1 Tax=Streptomyces sp. SDT5-1 TaxID=3406418 RepID=UPI003FCF6349